MKLAVSVDSDKQPVWIAACIRKLKQSESIELVAVELIKPTPGNALNTVLKAYLKWDQRLFTNYSNPNNSEKIGLFTRPYKPDYLLDFTGAADRDDVIIIQPWWSCVHFYEAVFRRLPKIQVGLTMASENMILESGYSRVDPFSPFLTELGILWKISETIPSTLEKMARGVPLRKSIPESTELNLSRVSRSWVNSILNIAKLISLKAFRVIRNRLMVKAWKIFISQDKSSRSDINITANYTCLEPKIKKNFYADPFIADMSGKTYLFFEEWVGSQQKGIIISGELKGGELVNIAPILSKPYHLSYPFIFEEAGQFFLIPESGNNRSVDLYKCTGNPYRWLYKRTLLSGIHAVDSTLVFKDELYWLFCNVKVHPEASSCEDLYLYYTDDLETGDFIAHPANPVVSDIETSRPAGHLFRNGDRWFRPSQDSTRHYGYALNLMEITRWSRDEYQERMVDKLRPGWKNSVIGNHTYNFNKEYKVWDAEIMKPKWKV